MHAFMRPGLTAVSLAFVAACGGGGSTEPAGPPNFAGNYAGKVRYFDPAHSGYYIDSTNVTATIQQAEGSVELSGSWTTPTASGGLLGTVNARFEGSVDLAFQQVQPCTGSFEGQGGMSTLNGQFYGISLQYQGTDCGGAYHASADLARVP